MVWVTVTSFGGGGEMWQLIFFLNGKLIQYSSTSHSCTALICYVFSVYLLETCLSRYILF